MPAGQWLGKSTTSVSRGFNRIKVEEPDTWSCMVVDSVFTSATLAKRPVLTGPVKSLSTDIGA